MINIDDKALAVMININYNVDINDVDMTSTLCGCHTVFSCPVISACPGGTFAEPS